MGGVTVSGGLAGVVAGSDVGLDAEDGLYTGVFAGQIELDGSVKGAVVGDSKGIHPQFPGFVGHVLKVAQAI